MKRRSPILLIYLLAVIFITDISAQEVQPYKVNRLNINSAAYNEISPAIYRDGLIFCSDRRFSGLTDRTSFDGRRLFSFYYSERIDSSAWKKPEEVNNERTSLFNNGPLCIATDGKTAYFTSEIETGVPSRNRRFRNRSGIFSAELTGLAMSGIKPFKYNSQDYDIGQPSLSEDGRFLFFASDMPGGSGGSDIYFCELKDGEWGDPVNLGPIVNSPGVDNYPHFSAGKLYFTSDRDGGMGGLDLYQTSRTMEGWSIPVLLPEPINSSSDDFAFVVSESQQSGFFASNRGKNDDIYEFITTIISKDDCPAQEENSYCYEFVEENAVKYDTLPFRYEWKFGDGSKAEGPVVMHCYSAPGTYHVQLDVVNLVTKEVSENIKSDFLLIEDIEQPYITCPDTVTAGKTLVLSGKKTNLPGWEITSYYWNFGDGTIANGDTVEKQYKTSGSYMIQLIVTARPGSDGIAREACSTKQIVITQR
ncbi:MAG: PKD domain-containing protein [Bacteroidales bacterium]|jgi:chitodextrinase|nr:PKD domain-containing protein [Bacteroidales bacterium]